MADIDVAIVHDYLTQTGGAERVVLAMARTFPGAPIYTSLYEPASTFPEFAQHDVRPLWTNKAKMLRADHRRGLPLYPLAFSSTNIQAALVLCSSSGFSHGVRTPGRKVVYCYTPARWLYEEADRYLAGWSSKMTALMRAATPPLRIWDRRTMSGADLVLTSSTAVARRIMTAYGISAEVVPPPAGISTAGEQQAIPGVKPGYLLSVGRLMAYKNVDAVLAALSKLPEARLVVVGDGPERTRLEALAPPNADFLGEIPDPQLRWLYANCAGVASAAYEDYGLTPLEAAAYGKPAAVLRFGGFLDTVLPGRSGAFFETPSPSAIVPALSSLLHDTWDVTTITAHAATFNEESFIHKLGSAVRPRYSDV